MRAYHHSAISSGLQFRESLRAGPYAWPGGYVVAFICDDGGALCPSCAKENGPLILRSIRAKARDGWRVVGCQPAEHWDDDAGMRCDHCSVEFSAI